MIGDATVGSVTGPSRAFEQPLPHHTHPRLKSYYLHRDSRTIVVRYFQTSPLYRVYPDNQHARIGSRQGFGERSEGQEDQIEKRMRSMQAQESKMAQLITAFYARANLSLAQVR